MTVLLWTRSATMRGGSILLRRQMLIRLRGTTQPLSACTRRLPAYSQHSSTSNRRFCSAAAASPLESGDDDDAANRSSGLFRLLSPHERSLLQEQRVLTASVRQLAKQVGVSALLQSNLLGDNNHADSSSSPLSPRAVLEQSSAFCIVVAGEFNAGKSTLINALLGQKLLETGALPTTDTITILSHPDQFDDTGANVPNNPNPNLLLHTVDLPLLQDLTLVDTPGTNAAVANHTATTIRLLPAADLILFCTSADRPFSDSERALLKEVAEKYRKSVVVVINKMDVLDQSGGDHGSTEKQRVVEFVTDHASTWLGAQPVVIPVSSRDALAAKLTGRASADSAVWRRSNFRELQEFLQTNLTTETKIRTKLSNPVNTATALVQQCLDQLQQEQEALETDLATLNLLQTQFVAWRREIQLDMDRSRTELTGTCRDQGERCRTLLRRASYWQLYQWTALDASGSKLQREWTKTETTFSKQGLKGHLEDMVREMADSIAVRGRAQGQAVIEFLGKRPAVQNQSLVGSVTNASSFADTRDSLTSQMSQAVQRHVDVDQETEEFAVLNGLRQSVWLSLGLNVGALGSALAAGLHVLDPVTGIASCAALAASSGLVLSTGPRKIAQQHADVWQSRSRNMEEAMESISAKELDRVDRRIRDGVSPYTRFVEAEQARIAQLTIKCEDVMSESYRLRKRIGELRFKD